MQFNDTDASILLKQFVSKFQPPMTKEFWYELVREEVKEVHEALAHLLKEYADLMYVVQGAELAGASIDEIEENAGSPSWLAVRVFEAIDPEILGEAFIRVHESNMSKLMPDGSVKRREDGKVLKGPNYREPKLMDLVLDGVTNPIVN
jgi:hypothetical protein